MSEARVNRRPEQLPYRVTLDLTLAAPSLSQADARLDEGIEALEALGFFSEGGSLWPMARDEVIADSPLDKALGEHS